jgi:hypothetical protein
MKRRRKYWFKELDFRLHRIQKEVLCLYNKLELAILRKARTEELSELNLEIVNAHRKLEWFTKAVNTTTS